MTEATCRASAQGCARIAGADRRHHHQPHLVLPDSEQFDLVGRLIADGWPPEAALAIWVPGCSSGEDAYSLAMVASHAGRKVQIWAPTSVPGRCCELSKPGMEPGHCAMSQNPFATSSGRSGAASRSRNAR